MIEPTAEQCISGEVLEDSDSVLKFACWYPQMGGYSSKCVIIIEKTDCNECFDACVWHDGDFPFADEDQNPRFIHHCNADQFIQFAELVKSKRVQNEQEGTSRIH